MNVRDHKDVVHLVLQEPARGSRRQELSRAGMTECVLYFRWFGQTPWVDGEFAGVPVEIAPTCLFCLTDV